jgi:hypothetical protein
LLAFNVENSAVEVEFSFPGYSFEKLLNLGPVAFEDELAEEGDVLGVLEEAHVGFLFECEHGGNEVIFSEEVQDEEHDF